MGATKKTNRSGWCGWSFLAASPSPHARQRMLAELALPRVRWGTALIPARFSLISGMDRSRAGARGSHGRRWSLKVQRSKGSLAVGVAFRAQMPSRRGWKGPRRLFNVELTPGDSHELERLGLAPRSRGRAPVPAFQCEEVS